MDKTKTKKPPGKKSQEIRQIPKGFIFKGKNNETPLFIAHGSVLVEINSGDKYTYRAENLKTGKTVIFGHRTDKLPEACYQEIAERMERCAAGNAWLSVDADNSKLFIQSRLQEILQIIFERILPLHGFVPREKQIELAREILTSFCRRILNALPPCEVTADVNDVGQFFHAKKALKYFDLMNRG